MGVLFGWQWITSHNHDYRFPESLGRAETLFSTNGWMDSLSNKIVLHNFYGTAREEVNRIWNELNNNGFPEHFWSYLKHTIERSVREINSSLLLSSWRNCYKSMDICGDCRRKKKWWCVYCHTPNAVHVPKWKNNWRERMINTGHT